MRVSAIDLKDFQSHKKATFHFSKGITTIKGSTDQGKSAILRALRWVCLNDLGGVDFIKEGSKKTTITLHTNTGIIERTKSKDAAENTYTLDDKVFKSFGQGVPDEVKAELRVEEINFQAQHDNPFWFSETGGEVSKKLNSVVDLSIIDKALGWLAGAVRRRVERQSLAEENLKKTKDELTLLLPQEERIKEYTDLASLRDEWEPIRTNAKLLHEILEKIKNNRVKDLMEMANDTKDLFTDGLKLKQTREEAGELGELIASITQETKRATPPPDFAEVKAAWEALRQARWEASHLTDVLSEAKDKKSLLETSTQWCKDAASEFHRIIKGKKCPLCQSQL